MAAVVPHIVLCVPSIFSLFVNQTDTMLTCSYSAIRTLCSASTSTTLSIKFNQSQAGFRLRMYTFRCLCDTLSRGMVESGTSWEQPGSIKVSWCLLRKKLYKTLTTHRWAAVLVRMLFEQMPYIPRKSLDQLYHKAGKQLFFFDYDVHLSSLPSLNPN